MAAVATAPRGRRRALLGVLPPRHLAQRRSAASPRSPRAAPLPPSPSPPPPPSPAYPPPQRPRRRGGSSSSLSTPLDFAAHHTAEGMEAESVTAQRRYEVLLTTPTTPTERMKEISKASEGFIYLVSVVGVTGPRPNVNPHVKDLLQEIKQVTDKAVAVGFGISTPDHVRQIAEWGADGVIIGSAMVRQLGEVASSKEGSGAV